jgi:hypothetical protein
MRKDMSKVIVERPRRGRPLARSIAGSRRLYRHQMDVDGEGARTRIGMKADIRLYVHHKEFSDLIGPLKRFLHKQVGRPWDSVLSEACSAMDLRSTVQWHLWVHLSALVETHTVWLDGDVLTNTYGAYSSVEIYGRGWYVHPVTGLLEAAPQRR